MKSGIGKKLTVSHAIGLALLLILIVFGYITLNSFSSIQKRGSELTHRMELIGDLQTLIHRILMPPNDYLITGDAREREIFAGLVTETASVFERMRIDESKTAEEKAVEERVEKGFVELQKKGMVLLSIENPVHNKEAAPLMKEMDGFAETVAGNLENLHKLIKEEMETHNKRTSAIDRWSYIVFAILGIISISGIFLISALINRGVKRPLLELADAAKIIGDGNLDYRTKIETGDEIEMLGSQFNGMAQQLKEKIDEIKGYSEKLEKTNRQLDQNILQLYTLYNVSKTITATIEMEKLLNQIVENVGQALKLHRINIMLINEERTVMAIVAGLGMPEKAEDMKFKLGEGIYGWAAVSGQPEIINNLPAHPRFKPVQGLDDDASSIICVPFKGRGEVIGVINAYRLGEVFDETSFELLTTVASQLGMTLESARLFEETKMLSITDGLTSLYNHRYFREALDREMERARRYERPLSLIMIDIDFFKKYNDTHGHPEGDKLLMGIAGIFKNGVRRSDIAARYGGEEFAIILPETEGETAFMLAERLRKKIEGMDFEGGETQPGGRVTISAGVSSYEGSGSLDELVKRADDALYRAKRDGRNRVAA